MAAQLLVSLIYGCRGAYIGFLMILACVFIILGKFIWQHGKEHFKKIFISVIGSMAALFTVVVLSVSSLRTRVFSIFVMREDSSTSFRFNVYQSAIHMIKDNWLLGIGVGNQNFRERFTVFICELVFDALSAYSIYLEIAVESGILHFLHFWLFLEY